VILDPDAYDLWLDPGMKDVAVASELLKPFHARLMRCYPVSTRLNNATNDDQECCAPVEPPQIQSRLFAHGPFSTSTGVNSRNPVDRWGKTVSQLAEF
jgi:hypothetical protein